MDGEASVEVRFECPAHGAQPGVPVSPDIEREVAQGRLVLQRREIAFEYDGEPVGGAVISTVYSDENGVPAGPTLPLPDDFPGWYEALRPVCEGCLAAAAGAQP